MNQHKKRNLVQALRTTLSSSIAREVYLGLVSFKVSRIFLQDDELHIIKSYVHEYGGFLSESEFRVNHLKDVGKGEWSNTWSETLPYNSGSGSVGIYIGSDSVKVNEAKEADIESDSNALGELLRIPTCCRNMYEKSVKKANQKQGDFTPFVAKNSTHSLPNSEWSNHLSQYFGKSLLSHFPCRFGCESTIRLAKDVYNAIAQADQAWADELYREHKCNILYTEYCGIFLFTRSSTKHLNGMTVLTYSPSLVQSTYQGGAVFDAISQGNIIISHSYNEFEIYHSDKKIANFFSEDFVLCLFA